MSNHKLNEKQECLKALQYRLMEGSPLHSGLQEKFRQKCNLLGEKLKPFKPTYTKPLKPLSGIENPFPGLPKEPKKKRVNPKKPVKPIYTKPPKPLSGIENPFPRFKRPERLPFENQAFPQKPTKILSEQKRNNIGGHRFRTSVKELAWTK